MKVLRPTPPHRVEASLTGFLSAVETVLGSFAEDFSDNWAVAMKNPLKPRTELKHQLLWYVENYGLSLNTVRRNRQLLDHPTALLTQLLSSRGPTANINQLADYLNEHPDATW